jgi:hypothetical protein
MLDKTKKDNRVKVLRGKLQKMAYQRPFNKSFMDQFGDIENVQDENPFFDPNKKLKGYGMAYSHPRHLNKYYGSNIKNFKDMDNALDKNVLMRVMDNEEGRTINIGNKATPEQLKTIKNQFDTHDKPVRASITSRSRKYYKTYDDFTNALNKHTGESPIDVGNKEFKTHTQNLMGKQQRKLQKMAFEFVDDDVGKNEKNFTSNLPNSLVNRMNRIIKLEKTLPPSRYTDFESARNTYENNYIDDGKPIRPSARFRKEPIRYYPTKENPEGKIMGQPRTENIVQFDPDVKKKYAKLKGKLQKIATVNKNTLGNNTMEEIGSYDWNTGKKLNIEQIHALGDGSDVFAVAVTKGLNKNSDFRIPEEYINKDFGVKKIGLVKGIYENEEGLIEHDRTYLFHGSDDEVQRQLNLHNDINKGATQEAAGRIYKDKKGIVRYENIPNKQFKKSK